MVIPASRIGTQFSVTGFIHPNPLFDTLTLAVDIENKQGTMMANGGPGSFEFCPQAVGPAAGACAAPLSATGGTMSLPVHGRISVTAGINQYGGAMGWLGSGLTGVVTRRNAAGAAATLFSAANFLAPFSVIGDATTPSGIIALQVASALLNFVYTTSMHTAFPGTPMENPAFVSSSSAPGAATAHIWTTGMVTASITAGDQPPFQAITLTGSDNRATTGPNKGSGNLTLVSGSLYQNYARAFRRCEETRSRSPCPSRARALPWRQGRSPCCWRADRVGEASRGPASGASETPMQQAFDVGWGGVSLGRSSPG